MKLPWWFPFGSVPEMSAADLAKAVRSGKAGPQILDVRSVQEFASGHIHGAVNVPVGNLQAGLAAVRLDPKRPVVAICLSAHRSIPAVRLLASKGFDARQLAGGMRAWRAAGLPESRR